MNLTGQQIKDTYEGLLNIGATGLTGALQTITDGLGNPLPMQVSSTTVNFTGCVTGIVGTTGPAGPTGVQGPIGPTGPAAPGGSSPITLEATNNLVSTAIGATAGSGTNCAIVLGNNACVFSGANNSIVIGNASCHYGYGSTSVLIGYNVRTSNISTIGIGENVQSETQRGLAIGNGAATLCNNALGAMAIGYNSVAQGNSNCPGIAIGISSYAFSDGIHLGVGGFSCESKSIVIGKSSQSFPGATGTVVLGNSSVGGTGACNSVVIGNSAESLNNNSIIIGAGAKETAGTNNPNIVIGKSACAVSGDPSISHVTIGVNACTSSNNSSVAIGQGAYGYNIGVGIGCLAQAQGAASIAIGGQAYSPGLYAIAFGRGSNAAANFSQSYGWQSYASHECSVALGANITTEKANTTHVNNLIAYGQAASKAYAIGTTGTNVSIDWDNSNVQAMTLLGSGTISLNNPIDGGVYTLQITQGTGGGHTLIWSNVKWPGGAPPSLSITAGATDILTFIYGPTAYYGNANLNFS